jgi:Putative abortive phage resistance protein AbiGi, antitoxin
VADEQTTGDKSVLSRLAAALRPSTPRVAIEDLLNRRSDLSTFVVHLTRDTPNGPSAKDNLHAILKGLKVEARSPMGFAAKAVTGPDLDSQKVVCFSETPLEHIYSLCAPIANRRVNLSAYGVAFTKVGARGRGANPVWYVDQTVGRTWHIANALNALRDAAVASGAFATSDVARVLPFIESMGTWYGTRKEFWWEREWRHHGDFSFSWEEVALVLCPEADIPDFEASSLGWKVIDPRWSLERMIAKLAGLPTRLTTPFGV